MGMHVLTEEMINPEVYESVDDIEKFIAKPDDKKIMSKKAARMQVERRAEQKELDKHLDAYYDNLLD